MRGGFQSLETKVLHARLLLAVVAHAEGAIARVLRLKLQFGSLGYRHLVVGEGGGSSVANTRRVGSAIVVYVELLLHVVVGRVVGG